MESFIPSLIIFFSDFPPFFRGQGKRFRLAGSIIGLPIDLWDPPPKLRVLWTNARRWRYRSGARTIGFKLADDITTCSCSSPIFQFMALWASFNTVWQIYVLQVKNFGPTDETIITFCGDRQSLQHYVSMELWSFAVLEMVIAWKLPWITVHLHASDMICVKSSSNRTFQH